MGLRSVTFAVLPVFSVQLMAACAVFDRSVAVQGPERDGSGRVVAAGQVEVLALEVGDCFDNPVAGEVELVTAIPCVEPHTFEVFHSFDLADGAYPGAEAMGGLWMDGCLAEFEPFVGSPFADSTLDVSAIYPTEESWGEGDREVVCSVTSVDGRPRSGSARASGL